MTKSRRDRPGAGQSTQPGVETPPKPGRPPTRRNKNAAPARGGPGASILLGLGAIVILAAAIAAVALTQAPSATPGTGAAGSSTAGGTSSFAPEADLPPYVPGAADPAVGHPIPEVDGTSFDGTPVSIVVDGRPKLIVFLAHWCPHCQREVPVVQAWLDANGMPASVELISVVTAINPNLPNYPPDAWLAREHWQVPVIVDADGKVATRYGLTAFPYWVVVKADGTVAQRLTGELTPAQLDTLVASVGPT
jgi:cytochrome c biogenesis protein CcmG/thiol:disulfide interchange protein DsbE